MGRLNLNAGSLDYFTGFSPILNWWKSASAYTVVRSVGGNVAGSAAWDAGYFDASTGDLASPVPSEVTSIQRVFYAQPGGGSVAAGQTFTGMQWKVKWDGTATLTIDFLTSGNSSSINNAAGTASFTMGTTPGNTALTFTVTNRNDPPRNIRIYQAQYETNFNNGELLNPDWVAEIANFKRLRFMDLMNTNGSSAVEVTDFASTGFAFWGGGSTSFGGKGYVPLAVLAAFANSTGREIHICIPHQASDACVLAMAQYFRDNVSTVVTYEYSNECWNGSFAQFGYCNTQGSTNWPGDGSRYAKFYGYRAAQCMKIIRDAYNSRSRWRGVIGTQTANTGVTTAAMVGVNFYLTNVLSNSLTVADLFNEIALTGYFGDVQISRSPTAVTKANPGVVSDAAHGKVNGERVRFSVNSGMVELNNVTAVVANKTTDTYELSGINTTGYTTWISDARNYTNKAPIFDLMTDSSDAHDADAVTYPIKYTLFNAKLAEAMRTGTATWTGKVGGTYTVSGSLATLYNTWWPAHKSVADSNGLEITQYEGGSHFVGDTRLNGFGGNALFNEYMYASGYSADMADVYRRMYSQFLLMGGTYPSKYAAAGSLSPFGTWPGMRFFPGDESNPIWVTVRDVNDGARPLKFTLTG